MKISRQANGAEVVVDVHRSDEFFGEPVLAGLARRMEMAVVPGEYSREGISLRPRALIEWQTAQQTAG